MTDVIEQAATGRSKCRACGQKIPAREFRFGEALPNPYAEGTTLVWFHVPCAACFRPEPLLAALEHSDAAIPEREWLRDTARFGATHRRLPRLASAERSKSGRAHCRSCRELIANGVWRLGLHMFEEGRANPIGYIHVECAEAYFGTTEILDRLQRLTPDLDAAAVAELRELLTHQRAAPAAEGEGDGEEAETGPPAVEGERPNATEPAPLAKTRPQPAASKRQAK